MGSGCLIRIYSEDQILFSENIVFLLFKTENGNTALDDFNLPTQSYFKNLEKLSNKKTRCSPTTPRNNMSNFSSDALAVKKSKFFVIKFY